MVFYRGGSSTSNAGLGPFMIRNGCFLWLFCFVILNDCFVSFFLGNSFASSKNICCREFCAYKRLILDEEIWYWKGVVQLVRILFAAIISHGKKLTTVLYYIFWTGHIACLKTITWNRLRRNRNIEIIQKLLFISFVANRLIYHSGRCIVLCWTMFNFVLFNISRSTLLQVSQLGEPFEVIINSCNLASFRLSVTSFVDIIILSGCRRLQLLRVAWAIRHHHQMHYAVWARSHMSRLCCSNCTAPYPLRPSGPWRWF
jgi:hypothetical protein